MKKYLLLFCLCLLSGVTHSQTVLIKGTALDSTKGRNRVTVVLNDTINKFLDLPQRNPADYRWIITDTVYRVRTKANGAFSIRARLRDSLYFESFEHIPQKYAVKDLLKRKAISIRLLPEVCQPYVPCKDTLPKHFVFVGEKVKVTVAKRKYYCNTIMMDRGYNAQYKVLQNVAGGFPRDTIRFVAYDHYGTPAFSKYSHVLLFVSEYCQELVHQKYQYYSLYKTAGNQWAAPYSASDYAALGPDSGIKPEIIKFREPVVIDVSQAAPEWVSKTFPAPYYKVENGKATAVYGNYVKELVEIKKQTVLKARGIRLK
ncbi:hypothetical protein [Hymenobacter lucidus]|uniref:Carboxypeptidase regulatory-like domain-containing protein n=1 Tax=Hymenobacter lucidus TaxID=2880930 RepID=A0ABS8ARQ4_9BACT|nr:hypothetical protein [Hymenobacter lucidus]MCB2408288.1 hypothetical protein [Hymenobacter lucidus]